jgi:hypothetical protein
MNPYEHDNGPLDSINGYAGRLLTSQEVLRIFIVRYCVS